MTTIISWNLLHLTGASVTEVAGMGRQERPDLLLMQEATEEIDRLPDLIGGFYARCPLPYRRHGLAVWSRSRLANPPRVVPIPSGALFDWVSQIVDFGSHAVANVHLSHGQALNGSVATFGIGRKTSASWDQLPSQAASWNRSAMNAAWALMSLPPMFRTCPFLIIAIASYPASVRRAVQKLPKPRPGSINRFMRRWSCSTMLFRYFTCCSRDRRHSSPSLFMSAAALG